MNERVWFQLKVCLNLVPFMVFIPKLNGRQVCRDVCQLMFVSLWDQTCMGNLGQTKYANKGGDEFLEKEISI